MGRLDCEPDDIYLPHTYSVADINAMLPQPVSDTARLIGSSLPWEADALLRSISIRVEPMQVHAMVLAVFASIVAPFGKSRANHIACECSGAMETMFLAC